MEKLRGFLELELFHVGGYVLHVNALISVAFILTLTKLFIWLMKKAIYRNRSSLDIEQGNLYALVQIAKYVIWVIAVALIFEVVGIKITVLLAGSAALLVGVGLGLQSTFNDFISGIILLSEGTIKIGDVLEIDGDVIMIQEIGIRTSKGLNRNQIIVILPNSLITTNKVINWSHHSKQTRFKISVGVAYGSDVDKVIKALTESATEHPDTKTTESTEVRFVDFGDSSLNFQVMFFSENIFNIERVKSDIRKNINRKFIEYGITIPFPQRDLHIKSDHTKGI